MSELENSSGKGVSGRCGGRRLESWEISCEFGVPPSSRCWPEKSGDPSLSLHHSLHPEIPRGTSLYCCGIEGTICDTCIIMCKNSNSINSLFVFRAEQHNNKIRKRKFIRHTRKMDSNAIVLGDRNSLLSKCRR